MIAIKNATLVMRDHLIPEAVLFVEDGIIFGFGEMRNTPIPADCHIYDAEGLYVGPGLVDIHTHACCGIWFYEDPCHAAQNALQHGTTTVLPTLYFNMTSAQLVAQIRLRLTRESRVKIDLCLSSLELFILNAGF